jgi:hypothetical protein
MKKLLFFMVILFVSLLGVSKSSLACNTPFCNAGGQEIEFWDIKTDGNWFNQCGESKTWTFDLDTDTLTPTGVNIDPEDTINKAYLLIYFTDDENDWYKKEYAQLIYDGYTPPGFSNFEVDAGRVSFNVSSFLSGTDHQLTVTITRNSGDFGVSWLKVHGCYTDNPPQVPEPDSLLLAGTGLVMMGCFLVWRRKKIKIAVK